MVYQALYRKYRSKTFDEVVGQEHVTTTLKNEIRAGKPSHAYLFTGSRGTGKTTCAKLVAKAVNCEQPREGNPCGICAICRGVDDGTLIDVAEVDAASNNGVDYIRQLREESAFMPAVARYRVYIIDEVHMLSAGAFNALLKTMEEPGEHLIFILATTEAHKVPDTIVSRCQRFDFRRIRAEDICGHLLDVAAREAFTLDEDAAMLIARLAEGGMRDALSLLDLASSYDTHITASSVAEAAGITLGEQMFDISGAVLRQDCGAVMDALESMAQGSADFERICAQLLAHYRNLMLAKTMNRPGDFIACLPDELERYREQAASCSLSGILHAMTMLQQALGSMARTAAKRTELEMVLILLCNPQADSSVQAMAGRIEKLERMLEGYVPGASIQAPDPKSSPKVKQGRKKEKTDADKAAPEGPPEAPMSEAVDKGAAVPFEQWEKVLEKLKKSNMLLFGNLADSRAYISGDIVLIDSSELAMKFIRSNDFSRKELRAAIEEVTGSLYRLGPYGAPLAEKAGGEKDPLEALADTARGAGVPVQVD